MDDVEGAAPPAKTMADLQLVRAFKLQVRVPHSSVVKTHRTIFRDRHVADAVRSRMQGSNADVDVVEAYIEDLHDGRCLHTDTETTADLNNARCFHMCHLTRDELSCLTAWHKMTPEECRATSIEIPHGELPDGWNPDDADGPPRLNSGATTAASPKTKSIMAEEDAQVVQSSRQWQDVLDRHGMQGWMTPTEPIGELCAFLLANEGQAVSAGMLHDWCEAGGTPAESHTDVLDEFSDQGWSTTTKLQLVTAFLHDNGSGMITATTDAFRRFLQRTVGDVGATNDD